MTSSTSKSLEERQESLRHWIPENGKTEASKGVNHIAVFSKDLEATAAFYTDVLGMPVVQVTSNRDVEESTHMNVSIGGGVRLSFLDFPPCAPAAEPGTGRRWWRHAHRHRNDARPEGGRDT